MMECFIACRRKSDLQSIIQRGEQEMLKTPIARGVALATLGATLAIPSMAQAAFIEDTKAAWSCVTSTSTVTSAKVLVRTSEMNGLRASCYELSQDSPKALSASASMLWVCWG